MYIPKNFTLAINQTNGTVQFIYTPNAAGSLSDIITVSTMPASSLGASAYSNILEAGNQTKNKFGIRIIEYILNDTSNINEIQDGFIFFNSVDDNNCFKSKPISLNSRVLSSAQQSGRAEVIVPEQEMDGTAGIVGTILPVNQQNPYTIGFNIFQSYIGKQRDKSELGAAWADANNLMAHSAGEIYIAVTRTSNNVTDSDGNPVSLPFTLLGVNDLASKYGTLMQGQLAALDALIG